jgi:hypothetical protein
MTTTIVLPTHPLTRAEVANLTAALTSRQIARAEGDIDYATIMADTKLRTSPRVFSNCIGSLVALGYGYEWIARMLGCDIDSLFPSPDSSVSTDLMRDALTMAIRIGSRWATPESTGQTEQEIEHAKERARANHRYPPAAYGQLYDYIAKSAGVEGTKRMNNASDALKIRALALLVEQDGGASQTVGQRVGTSGDTVERARKAIGLQVRHLGERGVVLAAGQDSLKRLVRRAAMALEAADQHPTTIWTRLLAEAADLHASAVANRRGDVAEAA